MVEKVVILARGLGTRMRRGDGVAAVDPRQAAVADTGVKALIPIDRPFLDYVFSGLAAAGFRRVCLVVGPEHGALDERYREIAPPRRLAVDFAVQSEPRGTADAVRAAEAFCGDDPFVMLNSDNYYPLEALRGLRELPGPGVALFDFDAMTQQSNIPPERLRQFAVGQVDAGGCLTRILEKPDQETWQQLPRPIWIGMNCWRLGPPIFDACRAIGPSARGEYEITDAVQYWIDRLGGRLTVLPVRAAVLDLSTRRDIAGVAQRLAGTEVDY